MKKIILLVAVILVSLSIKAQKPEYFKVMGETLSQYAFCKNPADFKALGNKFQMIANAETKEWLPLYFYTHCQILTSFMEQDAEKKDMYLDVAEKSLNQLLEMTNSESEVFVLQSLYYSGRIIVNPMERGQEYSQLAGQALGKAFALDSANPRAKLMKLQMDIGSAPYMGKDPRSYCPQVKELLANWDNYKPKSALHPNWGKEQIELVAKSCN